MRSVMDATALNPAEWRFGLGWARAGRGGTSPRGRPILLAAAVQAPRATLRPTVKIYPDSGHGFLFQYPAEFATEVNRFVQ
jgi:hypothetical protein